MRNHTNTINRIANTLVLFFALFGISSNALAQDYTCPVNAIERDQRVFDMNNVLEFDVNDITALTGYKSYDEAQLYCDQTIKEKTARVNELHIDDYEGTLAQMKRERDEAKDLLEQQTATCNACLSSKRDAYEKKFIKKHGDHRYDTKGYRTKVVVVWGEAERIPTDAQAKYDLLYDEYMSDYNPSKDRQDCLESTPACKDAVETESKIRSLSHQMSELQERHENEKFAQDSLKQITERCSSVAKSTEKHNEHLNYVAFLKECKYPEKPSVDSSNANTGTHQNVNVNSLQQADKAISKVRSFGRAFGF